MLQAEPRKYGNWQSELASSWDPFSQELAWSLPMSLETQELQTQSPDPRGSREKYPNLSGLPHHWQHSSKAEPWKPDGHRSSLTSARAEPEALEDDWGVDKSQPEA